MQPALGKAPGEREKTQPPADQTGQGLRKSSGVQGGAHQEKGRGQVEQRLSCCWKPPGVP